MIPNNLTTHESKIQLAHTHTRAHTHTYVIRHKRAKNKMSNWGENQWIEIDQDITEMMKLVDEDVKAIIIEVIHIFKKI